MEISEHKHIISVLVENRPGVLARVSGLFSRRGFNIESLAVGVTKDPLFSRISLVVDGDDRVIEQVTKQLNKLIDVIKVSDITHSETVLRELMLVKINAKPEQRTEILSVSNTFRGKVVDIGDTSMIVEITGQDEKIDAFIRLMKKYGILEIVRTGKVVLVRGAAST